MCGRYRLTRKKEILAEHFGIEPNDNWHPRYNVAPTQNVEVVRQDAEQPRRIGSTVRWGLIPFWAKDASIGYKMINARCETIAEKPAYRDALKKRRCLIPADGFYEWQKNGKFKTPFCFTLADDGVFGFAGIWERWIIRINEAATCSFLRAAMRGFSYVKSIAGRPDCYHLHAIKTYGEHDSRL
jgi:putative SOS response-associated peptidase YedK